MKYQKMLRLVVINTEILKCVLSRLKLLLESAAVIKNVGLRLKNNGLSFAILITFFSRQNCQYSNDSSFYYLSVVPCSFP